ERVAAADGDVVDAGPRGESVRAESALVDDQDGGSSIGDLAGKSSGDPASLAQGWQRADLGPVGFAGPFVGKDSERWHNFPVEAALGPRPDRALVRRDCTLLHVVAAQVPLFSDHVCRPEL